MLVSLVAFVLAFAVNAPAQSNPGAKKATTEKVSPAKENTTPAKACCNKSATGAAKTDCAKTCSKPCDHEKKAGCNEGAAKTNEVPVPKAK